MTNRKIIVFVAGWSLALPLLPLLFPAPLPARTVARENAVVRAVRKVSPAVVNVATETPAARRSPFGGDPMFEWFFRDFFEPPPRRAPRERNSLGSGVVIDGKEGLVLTNAHVISQTGSITVVLQDEREFSAEIVGADPDSDLAILRVSADKRLPEIGMGDSEDLMIGEDVIAIGNPFGFSHTVTTGVISALHRSIRAGETVYHDFIQTDASINPGNSGGPLLNIHGELIGINTAIYAKAQGIGFAIPINKARRIVAELIRHGEVTETWIGVTVQDMDPRTARYLNAPTSGGALIRRVEDKSPASAADLREGDIVLNLGGIRVQNVRDFYDAMRGYAPGEMVRMTIWRDGRSVKREVQAQAFPTGRASELAMRLLGIRVRNSGEGDGVVITDISPGSFLATVGARPGDRIHRIDELPTRNVDEFERAVARYRNKRSVVVLLVRGTQGYYITVRLN
ncbi:MAG: trypsin-like peptidase domain-containing protein [Thermodesulfobacteriota bacterium]